MVPDLAPNDTVTCANHSNSSLLELDRCFGFLFALHLFSSKLVNKVYQSPVNVCFTIGQLYSVSLNRALIGIRNDVNAIRRLHY